MERAGRACIARAQYIRVITICRGSRDQYQPEVGSANANNPYCCCLHSTASRDRIHLVSKFRIASSTHRSARVLHLLCRGIFFFLFFLPFFFFFVSFHFVSQQSERGESILIVSFFKVGGILKVESSFCGKVEIEKCYNAF